MKRALLISCVGAFAIAHAAAAQQLDRSKRPPVMTRAGEAFYKGTRPILQRYFALEEEVKSLKV